MYILTSVFSVSDTMHKHLMSGLLIFLIIFSSHKHSENICLEIWTRLGLTKMCREEKHKLFMHKLLLYSQKKACHIGKKCWKRNTDVAKTNKYPTVDNFACIKYLGSDFFLKKDILGSFRKTSWLFLETQLIRKVIRLINLKKLIQNYLEFLHILS